MKKAPWYIIVALFILIALTMLVGPAIMFTIQLRSLYSYNTTTAQLYITIQMIWIGVICFGAIVLQDRETSLKVGQ